MGMASPLPVRDGVGATRLHVPIHGEWPTIGAYMAERFFHLDHAQAFEIMLMVHKKGLAVVGVFSYEVAETKVAQVMDFSRRHQHPLQCTMEKE